MLLTKFYPSFWHSTDQVVKLLEPPMSPVLTDGKDKTGSVTSKTARGTNVIPDA